MINYELLPYLQDKVDLNTLLSHYDNDYLKVGLLLKELEDYGFNIIKELDSTGNLYFSLGNDVINNYLDIILKSNFLKVLIISDMHIGNQNDGLNYIDKIYEYCKTNNINIIFNIGDIFAGVYSNYNDKLELLNKQLDLFNTKYPYCDNIINVLILGNHDYASYKSLGFNISKYLKFRPDFINLGFGLGKIKIGNSSILLEHDLLLTNQPQRDMSAKYIFRGHSHKFEIVGNQITVPALLNSNFYSNLTSFGFIEAKFTMDSKNEIESCSLKQFDIKDEFRLINNIELNNKNIKIKKKI